MSRAQRAIEYMTIITVLLIAVAFLIFIQLMAYPIIQIKKRVHAIDSNLRLDKKAGMTDSIIDGRKITRTKDLFILKCTSFESIKKFSKLIDFSIKRKKEKLSDAIRIIENFKSCERSIEWKKLYYKNKKQWVRQLIVKIATIDD